MVMWVWPDRQAHRLTKKNVEHVMILSSLTCKNSSCITHSLRGPKAGWDRLVRSPHKKDCNCVYRFFSFCTSV